MLFETLETRRLLSVSLPHVACAPGGSASNSTIAVDEKQIDAAQMQLQMDNWSSARTLVSDVKALLADGLRHDATLMPLFQQLQADGQVMRQDLEADEKAGQTVVSHDQTVINTEELQVCKDKHNPTALKADQAALLADRIQLENDVIAAIDARLATLQADENTIADDLGAINGALSGDTAASPKLVGDVGNFRTDALIAMYGLATDLLGLIGAHVSLVNDLIAMQT